MSISASSLPLVLLLLLWPSSFPAVSARVEHEFCTAPLFPAVERKTVASSDCGSISTVDASDGFGRKYHLQFFALEPQSLLIPLHLHTDMVFYVHSGRGTISWISAGEATDLDLKKGDIYRIGSGSVFYVRSHPDPLRQKLRIHAIFTPMTSDSSATQELTTGAYSNLADLIRGFDEQVLRMGFRVSEEVISALKSVDRPPFIVPFTGEKEKDAPGWKEGIFEALIGVGRPLGGDNGRKKKKKEEQKRNKGKAFNILDAEPDVQNCNGQSIAITDKEFHVLKGSDVGVFMVNLTKGSMMGPHWNPRATEVAIVTEGEGMVQVVLPRISPSCIEGDAECTSWRFRVREGDVFVVPRYHTMAQMSFNNGSFSLVGFSSSMRKNRPQFLAGKRSVLQTLDKDILALSLGVANKTIVEKLLEPQGEAIMLDCTSCAEEVERTEEEIEKRRREEEEARRKEEEEARKREEEEEARRREEEEEARRREKEEERREEEEEARRREREKEEEERREEEEEARRREREKEEEERRQEEEEARRREREKEEEERREEEEEARSRAREKEEERRRQEEEESRRREREREEEDTREEEEGERRRDREKEEEETREEEDARREQKEEATRKEKGEKGRRRRTEKK